MNRMSMLPTGLYLWIMMMMYDYSLCQTRSRSEPCKKIQEDRTSHVRLAIAWNVRAHRLLQSSLCSSSSAFLLRSVRTFDSWLFRFVRSIRLKTRYWLSNMLMLGTAARTSFRMHMFSSFLISLQPPKYLSHKLLLWHCSSALNWHSTHRNLMAEGQWVYSA